MINYRLYQNIKDKGNAWLSFALVAVAAILVGIALLPDTFILLKAVAAAYVLLP